MQLNIRKQKKSLYDPKPSTNPALALRWFFYDLILAGGRGPARGGAWPRAFHPSVLATNREAKEGRGPRLGRAPFTLWFWPQTER